MTTPHAHEPFDFPPDYRDPLGRPVDHGMLGAFIGAAVDGCGDCQQPLLQQIAEDAATTTRLVELACISVQATLGGLPGELLDPAKGGVASEPFRHLASCGLDGQSAEMLAAAESMAAADRRAALGTAANLLIGTMSTNIEQLRERD